MELWSRTLQPTTPVTVNSTANSMNANTPSDEEPYFSPGAQATNQPTSSSHQQDIDDSISHVSESLFSASTVIPPPGSQQNMSYLHDLSKRILDEPPPPLDRRDDNTRTRTKPRCPSPPRDSYAWNYQEENRQLQAKIDSLYEQLHELNNSQSRSTHINFSCPPEDQPPIPPRQPHISFEEPHDLPLTNRDMLRTETRPLYNDPINDVRSKAYIPTRTMQYRHRHHQSSSEEPDDFLPRNRERGRSRSHYNSPVTDMDSPPAANRSPSNSPTRNIQFQHRPRHSYQEDQDHDVHIPSDYPQHRRSRHMPDYLEQGYRRRRQSPARSFDEPRQSMPYFYGKPNEWENFWMKFEILSRKYHWDGQKQKENLILCMRDDAAAFVTSLNADVRENTRNFITALKERFSHRTPARTHRAKLENVQKMTKETVQEYASRVQLMMSKAYGDIEGTTTYTDLAVQHLLKGLQDQQMAYEISIRTPKSISEAVDMIILHEACKNNTRRRNEVRHLATLYSEDSESEDSGDDIQLDLRRLNGKKFVTEDRLFQFARDLKQSLRRNNPRNNDNDDHEMRKDHQARHIDTIICFNCQKEGHISTRCPEKKIDPKSRDDKKNHESYYPQKPLNFKGLSLQAESQSKQ